MKKINNIKKYFKIYEEELNILKNEFHNCIKNKKNYKCCEYFEIKMNYINSLASVIETLLLKNYNNNNDKNKEWIENIKKQALNFNQIKILNKYLKLSNKEFKLANKISKKCKNKKFN